MIEDNWKCKHDCSGSEIGWSCKSILFSTSTCKPICGDGIRISPEEECDDGNQRDFDGCSIDCFVEEHYSCYDLSPDICEKHVEAVIDSIDIFNRIILKFD